MSRQSKGAHLLLRRNRVDSRSGKPLPDIWFIRDGKVERSTGCGPDRLSGPDGAEDQLAAYILEKAAANPNRYPTDRASDLSQVLIADVLAYYATHHAPTLAAPGDTGSRVTTLLGWWGDKTLADVRRSVCKAYVAHRCTQTIRSARHGAALERKVTPGGARRELEDLSAAITFWRGEFPISAVPKVWLPDKPQSARDALTRDQVAALLKAARGWRWLPYAVRRDGAQGAWQKVGHDSGAENRDHNKRSILIGCYTGTRPGVIPRILRTEGLLDPWADLDAAIIYRRGTGEREHRTKRRPVVKIPRRLLAHMRRWQRLDERRAEAKGRDLPATIVHHGWTAVKGRPRRSFAACIRDAGLPEEVTPHWLRHTCATWLMQAGVDYWKAAGFTGMTVKTLETHYAHHRPDYQSEAAEALG